MATQGFRYRGGLRTAAGFTAAAALLLGGGLLSGCSTNVGELQFPAVHDMPPPRTDTMLSDAEQKKAQQDLVTARDSIEARAQQNAQAEGPDGGPATTGAIAAAPSAATKSAAAPSAGKRSVAAGSAGTKSAEAIPAPSGQ